MRRVQMYRVLCHRLLARELGAGLTWLKQDGHIVEFSTIEEAGAKAKELNESITMSKVKYTAKQYDSGGDE
jgi:hypothetical protein